MNPAPRDRSGTDADIPSRDELLQRVAELELMLRRKDEILTMVTHDLRNPLGSVAGFAELLGRSLAPSLGERDRALLDRIERLSEHMLTLVDDLLDVSVIQRGELALRPNPTDVTALVEEALDSYRAKAQAKQVTLLFHRPPEPVVACVDRSRVLQVVDNLLSNAVKYSPNLAGATVSVTCRMEADKLRLTVADEGVGIPEHDHDRMFEAFAGGRTAGTAEERSTGLGLSICSSLVRAHGGTITIDSEPGHGTVFEVLLPSRPSQGRQQDRRSPPG